MMYNGQQQFQGRNLSNKKKRDSFLGDLEQSEDASSDEENEQKEAKKVILG